MVGADAIYWCHSIMEFFNVAAMGVQLSTELKRVAIYLISRYTLAATLVLQDWCKVVWISGVLRIGWGIQPFKPQ